VRRVQRVADACRINALSSIMEAGSGHIGTSFSVMDLLVHLHLEVLEGDDVCFSSKGHDAPAVYAVLAAVGKLDFGLLHKLRRQGGTPGPSRHRGGAGARHQHGLARHGASPRPRASPRRALQGRRRRAFVVTGDGELQEGQFWESLAQAPTRASARSRRSSTTTRSSRTRGSARYRTSATSRRSSPPTAGLRALRRQRRGGHRVDARSLAG
jgi:transketolase